MAKGGRGNKSISVVGGGGGISAPKTSPAVEKQINKIAKQTANLKKEQYRVINEDGEVVFKKQGKNDRVEMTVGEKRQYLDGATSIHNHPNDSFGGTFSENDLTDFGYGAKEIVVAAPEGTYRLKNARWGTKEQSKGWYDMREEYRKMSEGLSTGQLIRDTNEAMKKTKISKEMNKISEKWTKRRSEGASESELKKLSEQYFKLESEYKKQKQAIQRQLEIKPYHDFLKANAKKYGFVYEYPKTAD